MYIGMNEMLDFFKFIIIAMKLLSLRKNKKKLKIIIQILGLLLHWFRGKIVIIK